MLTMESGLDRLRAAAKPKTPSKDTPPDVSLPSAAALLRKWDEAKTRLKDCQAELDALKADAIALVEPRRVELSRKAGKCLSSIKVNDVTYIHQNRYAAIKDESESGGASLAEREADLRASDPDFDVHFVEELTISVDAKKLNDEQVAALLGMSPEISRTLKPTAALHSDRTLKPSVAAFADVARLCPVQYFK